MATIAFLFWIVQFFAALVPFALIVMAVGIWRKKRREENGIVEL
jgi:hypothetical protein